MTEIGPVDYLIVAFPGNEFRGEIAPALAELVDAGTIRIIDLAFVGKDAEGNVAAFELMDIDQNVREVSRRLESRSTVCSTRTTSPRQARSSSRTPRPRSSSGRTSGRATWRRRCVTPVVSCSISSASPTRSSRRLARPPSPTSRAKESEDANATQRPRLGSRSGENSRRRRDGDGGVGAGGAAPERAVGGRQSSRRTSLRRRLRLRLPQSPSTWPSSSSLPDSATRGF